MMAPTRPSLEGGRGRRVFVTVGTTLFEPLVDAVLAPEVLRVLAGQGYRSVTVQYGKGKRSGAT